MSKYSTVDAKCAADVASWAVRGLEGVTKMIEALAEAGHLSDDADRDKLRHIANRLHAALNVHASIRPK